MAIRAALLTLMLLAGCATSSPEPVSGAASVPVPGATAGPPPPAATSRAAVSSRPSDWALAVVGTPFVLGFRAVVCTASVVVAAPTAALLAVSDDPHGGFDYLRDGLAQNCGPPYLVPVPVVADRAGEPRAGHPPAPDQGPPRPLTPYTSAALISP